MPYVKSNANKDEPVNIYYEDMGSGKAIVLIHGWPLSGSMWEYQVDALLQKGYRCITYDRRGFGRSDYPGGGYDYKTMAGDLHAVLIATDAEDATLVGFSMGGGEVAKYFSEFEAGRIQKAILVSTVLPFMLKTDDNEDGVPQNVFDGMAEGLRKDRPGFLAEFNKGFYGIKEGDKTISEAYLNIAVNRACTSSLVATLACANSFATTDFRTDMPNIKVPTLIIHGTEDGIVPIDKSSDKTTKLLPDAKYIKYEGAPHGLWYTHKDKLVDDIADFVC